LAQRHIEVLIGRLITDESFRAAFLTDPKAALLAFSESGHELTAVEIAALQATRSELWSWVAEQVDPRLQKASLTTG
jgi:hypothetical protein